MKFCFDPGLFLAIAVYFSRFIIAASVPEPTELNKRDNSYKFSYSFLNSNFKTLQTGKSQCYAFSKSFSWNFGMFGPNALAVRSSCQQIPNTCGAPLYIPNSVQTYGTDIYFKTGNLPTDSTVCVAWTGWGCCNIVGIIDGRPGSGGSGYICDGENKWQSSACFKVPRRQSIVIKMPYNTWSGGTALLGDTIAVYEGYGSLNAMCTAAQWPVGLLTPTNPRTAPAASLSDSGPVVDPYLTPAVCPSIIANCNNNFQAVFGSPQQTTIADGITLVQQQQLLPPTINSGPAVIGINDTGLLKLNSLPTGKVIKVKTAIISPVSDVFLQVKCGSSSSVIELTNTQKLVISKNCSFVVETNQSDLPPLTLGIQQTTAFTSTKADGQTVVQSGVVIVSTDANGSLFTTTSLIPPTVTSPPLTLGIQQTTAFTSTKADGQTVVETGVVIVSTDANGSLFTTTSLIKPTVTSPASVPSKSSTTSVPAKSSTTSVPAKSSTTSVPAKSSTTSVPAKSSTTSQPSVSVNVVPKPKSSTTDVPAVSSPESVPAKSSTTSVPSVSSTTSVPSVSSPAYVPSVSSTTSVPAKSSTTSVPAVSSPESQPSVSVNVVPKPKSSTTDVPSVSSTASVPAKSSTECAGDSCSSVSSNPVSSMTTPSDKNEDLTVTKESTTIITITSCSHNKCHESTVSATRGPTTVTVDGTTTVYTTWCPLPNNDSTVTKESTKIITITSCSENKCHESTVAATMGPTTVTVNGTTTAYTTWCPLSNKDSMITKENTKIITMTSCSENKCHESTVAATMGPTTVTVNGTTTVYTTWCPLSNESGLTFTSVEKTLTSSKKASVSPSSHATPGTDLMSTVATSTSISPVAIVKNNAGSVGASLAVIALPLAYFL